MIQNYNFGVDLDNTLTNENPFKSLKLNQLDELTVPVSETLLLSTPKKGIDIIRNKELNIIIITGRMERFRNATVDWLNKHNIPFNKLVMCPENYFGDSEWNQKDYLQYKLYAYLHNRVQFALDDDAELISLLSTYNIKACLVQDDFQEAFNNLFKGEK